MKWIALAAVVAAGPVCGQSIAERGHDILNTMTCGERATSDDEGTIHLAIFTILTAARVADVDPLSARARVAIECDDRPQALFADVVVEVTNSPDLRRSTDLRRSIQNQTTDDKPPPSRSKAAEDELLRCTAAIVAYDDIKTDKAALTMMEACGW